jgi:hypothetical protein
MVYQYRMVQVPPTIVVKDKSQQGSAAANYLQSIANQLAGEGWEFYRVDTVGIADKPGCLASLLGAQQTVVQYYVITFRKEV